MSATNNKYYYKSLVFIFSWLHVTTVFSTVYSSWEVGKYQCFSLIKERFNGPNVQFCAIGDGWEECEAAENMQWPFVQIDPGPVSTSHRFPGLNLETLGHYISVVYGDSDDEDEWKERKLHCWSRKIYNKTLTHMYCVVIWKKGSCFLSIKFHFYAAGVEMSGGATFPSGG